MLLPKPRLLSVLEIMAEPSAKKSTRTDKRYPRRRGLERAAQNFVTYWLVSSLFADSTETESGARIDRKSIPTATTPE